MQVAIFSTALNQIIQAIVAGQTYITSWDYRPSPKLRPRSLATSRS